MDDLEDLDLWFLGIEFVEILDILECDLEDVDTLEYFECLEWWCLEGGSYLVDGIDIVNLCFGFCESCFLAPNNLLPRNLNIDNENRPP